MGSFEKALDHTAVEASTAKESDLGMVEAMQADVEKEKSFKRLFEQYYSRVEYFFETQGASRSQAVDLARETFLKAYESLSLFQAPNRVDAWLFDLARRVWQTRQSARLSDEEQKLLKALRHALEGLPAPMRQTVLLRVGRDLSYREIADVMKIPMGSVKSYLSQAREQLAESLGGQFERSDLEL